MLPANSIADKFRVFSFGQTKQMANKAPQNKFLYRESPNKINKSTNKLNKLKGLFGDVT